MSATPVPPSRMPVSPAGHAGVRVSRHRRDRAGAQREQDQGDTHQRAQAAPNQVQQPDELDVLAHVIAIRTSTEIGEAEEASR